jgi:hypothetical protein
LGITRITIKSIANDVEASLRQEFMILLEFAYCLRCLFLIPRLEGMNGATRELFMDRFSMKNKESGVYFFPMTQNELVKQGRVRNKL